MEETGVPSENHRLTPKSLATFLSLGLDAVKKEMVWPQYMVWYFNGIGNATLLHYYLIHFVVNSHVYDPGQSLINDNFTVVSIVKSTFKK